MSLIQPNADEARNGWTAEKLTEYHNSRNRALDQKFSGIPYAWGIKPEGLRNRPTQTTSKYSPHKW